MIRSLPVLVSLAFFFVCAGSVLWAKLRQRHLIDRLQMQRF